MQVLSPGGIVDGPPHSKGGVPFVLRDTGRHVEEEGMEINIPRERTEDEEVIIEDPENPVQEIDEDLEENLESEIEDKDERSIEKTDDEQPSISCICLWGYLEAKNPELLERFITEDIESNPELSQQLDEEVKKMNGGKL